MTIQLKPLLLTIALLPTLALLSCAEATVKRVDYASSLEIPIDAHPRPLKFSKLRVLLPPGMEVGLEGYKGRFCSWPRYPISRSEIKKKIDMPYIKQSFHDAMEANGYDVVDSIDIDYDANDDINRAEYSVSAKIKDIDIDSCTYGDDRSSSSKGRMYVAVDWTIYDLLRRHVVYQTKTEGYTQRIIPNVEGMTLMFNDAFEMATHNLAADNGFYDLVVEGKKPAKHWYRDAPFAQVFPDAPRKFDANEPVTITHKPLSIQPFAKHGNDWRKVAVTVQKNKHGSGFFITNEGHIITNYHTVGAGQRERIITADKKYSMIAEVLRVDKVRDVALLKVEDMPAGFIPTLLPIRTEKPHVGEDVYTIGTPVDSKTLDNTVSKGVLSAHRNKKVEGIRLPFIQADVQTHGGNYGGPLLDEQGNIIGISASGRTLPDSNYGVGINFFIPIERALEALNITLE